MVSPVCYYGINQSSRRPGHTPEISLSPTGIINEYLPGSNIWYIHIREKLD